MRAEARSSSAAPLWRYCHYVALSFTKSAQPQWVRGEKTLIGEDAHQTKMQVEADRRSDATDSLSGYRALAARLTK